MASPKLYNLLRIIHQQTTAGTIKWQTTVNESAFRIGLGSGIVRIEKIKVYSDPADEEVDGYRATLMDKNGKPVDELYDYEPLNEPNVFVRDLFSNARVSALDIDDILDSMFRDLEEGRTQPLNPENDILF
jgi:hypothetical protein